MLLVSHKMTFLENEAALLCVTMRKRSRAITSTMPDMKFLSRRHSVENEFTTNRFNSDEIEET